MARGRLRSSAPLRAQRCGPGPHARAHLRAGRRAHLLHAGPGAGRDHAVPRPGVSRLRRLRLRRGAHRHRHAPGPAAGQRRGLGPVRAGARASGQGQGAPVHHRRGEGAFYGPKIEFHLKDALGRPWQLGTIQADFNLPERFDLTYVGEDNTTHRPVMLHRAVLGSVERFFGVLIEHVGGSFPTWLAPEQVHLVTVAPDFNDYAEQAAAELRKHGFRVTMDLLP
ncbi:MAG: hypothetical protein H6725_08110 [Sandaracinaceae bacterium]|nr:hypothetical protein [Sandaracinaceae bacterium]